MPAWLLLQEVTHRAHIAPTCSQCVRLATHYLLILWGLHTHCHTLAFAQSMSTGHPASSAITSLQVLHAAHLPGSLGLTLSLFLSLFLILPISEDCVMAQAPRSKPLTCFGCLRGSTVSSQHSSSRAPDCCQLPLWVQVAGFAQFVLKTSPGSGVRETEREGEGRRESPNSEGDKRSFHLRVMKL